MRLFPVFLDLCGRSCLVVGGGRVGRDKAGMLLEAGAAVTVVEPSPSGDLDDLARSWSALRVEPRSFADADCAGRALVFACTGDAAVNAQVLEAASAHGAPSCASGMGGDDGDFSCGAVLRRGDVCVAVSSGGASPTLAAAARDRVASVVGEEFAMAASMLAALRVALRREVPEVRARRAAMRSVVGGGLVELLEAGHFQQAEALVSGALATALATGEAGRDGLGAKTRSTEETGRCTR